MKNKKRYLAIEIDCEEKLTRNQFIKGIWNNAISLIGDYGVSKTDLWIHDYDGKYAIIECKKDKINLICQIISTTYKINNNKTKLNILGISGTIKKVKKKFIQKKEE